MRLTLAPARRAGIYRRSVGLPPAAAEWHGQALAAPLAAKTDAEAARLIAEGQAHHRAGRLAEAAAVLQAAAARAPSDVRPWRMLGLIAQQQSRFADSLELTQRALALERTAPDLSNLANALNQLGRHEQAASAAQEAVALDPRLGAAHANAGVAARALGRLDSAVEHFRTAAALQPQNAEAHANLGVALTESGAAQEAEVALETAARLAPQWADAWYNLGNVRLRRLKTAPAEAAYRRALHLQPGHADAHANLATALKALGRGELALGHYADAARLRPGDWRVLQNHALMLAELGRHAEAVGLYERAIGIEPEQATLHANLGSALQEWARRRADAGVIALLDRAILASLAALALDPQFLAARSNLGLALMARGRTPEAVQAFETAIARWPEVAACHSNLGQCLCDLQRYEEAAASCLRALALEPEMPEAWSTLGNARVGQHRHAEAGWAYEKALALRPEMAGAWCNLGVARFRTGDIEGAEAAYVHALSLDPELADAHWNQALVRLQRGDYAAGFAQYEWRLKRSARLRDEAQYAQPIWDGRPLHGQPILVHAEQGFGDAIQCVRFLPQVAARGGRVVLQARAPLKRLLESAPGVDALVVDGEAAPRTAWRAPLFSLPRLFVRSDADLPGPVPYLTVDPALRETWRARVREVAPDGLRIGVVWSGNLGSEVEQGRSIPLSAFTPLVQDGVRLVSLQKGDGLEQLSGAPFPVADLGEPYQDGDFADTAAVLAGLDLLVCCDTAVAHLAGAIGAPVWLAVSAVSDWRWLERRADSPWYPTLRLFRQAERGDWRGVFAAMAQALATELQAAQSLESRPADG